MGKNDFGSLLSAMAKASQEDVVVQDTARLKELLESLKTNHDMKVGDIVEWKEGLKNKRSAGPFVVVEILDQPVYSSTDESGSSYFREPLDIILGHVDSDGDFMSYHYDSRRFKPVV